MRRWKEISTIPTTVLLLAILLWVAHRQGTPVEIISPAPPPDFASIKDIKTKKDTFFTYMLPFVQQANEEIRRERAELLKVAEKINAQQAPSDRERELVNRIAQKYRVTSVDPFSTEALEMLNRRVDTIPASLALAQAANESAWGTARFARLGNNFFGLWCWSKKCGLVPAKRNEGAKHEVAKFESPGDSVKYYMLTLNSHPAYKDLRRLRAEARANNESLTGILLAKGLLSYSERRDEYVEEVQAMIRVNGLRRFNQSQPEDLP